MISLKQEPLKDLKKPDKLKVLRTSKLKLTIQLKFTPIHLM
jgi:hypothetical protein